MKSGEDAGMTIKKIPAGITQHFRLVNFYWNFFFSHVGAGLAVLIASAASNWLYARSTSSRSTRKDSISATPPRRRPWPPARRTRASPRANREKSCSTVSFLKNHPPFSFFFLSSWLFLFGCIIYCSPWKKPPSFFSWTTSSVCFRYAYLHTAHFPSPFLSFFYFFLNRDQRIDRRSSRRPGILPS